MNSTHRLVGVVAVAALLAGAPARAAWLVGTTPGPIDGPGDQAQTEKFSKTVPLAKGGSLDLANISGDIVVTGGAGDQVVIDAVKRGKTAEDLKSVTIEVTATANRVEVRAQYPRERRNVNVSVDFTVSVPRGASVRVHSVSGDLKVATVDGGLTAETVSGDVVLTSVAQLETARSVSGNVTVETGGSDGDLSVESVSGDVVLKAVKARGHRDQERERRRRARRRHLRTRQGQLHQRRHRVRRAAGEGRPLRAPVPLGRRHDLRRRQGGLRGEREHVQRRHLERPAARVDVRRRGAVGDAPAGTGAGHSPAEAGRASASAAPSATAARSSS